MIAEDPASTNYRFSILHLSQTFLLGLGAGATDETLSFLLQIRKNELGLIKEQKLMLHPRLWNILLTRYWNRRPKDIIDTLN